MSDFDEATSPSGPQPMDAMDSTLTNSASPPPTGVSVPPPPKATFKAAPKSSEPTAALIIGAVVVCALVATSALLRGISGDHDLAFAIGRASGSLLFPVIGFAFFRQRKGNKAGWTALLLIAGSILVLNSLQNLPTT